jgi:glycosidase
MIYYGSEAGMWGADDPDCRKPMLWPDYQFDDEKSHPLKNNRPVDSNSYDHELFQWYSKLITLRNNHPVLGTGAFELILTRDESDILAFRRAEAGKEYVVVLNNAWVTQRVKIPISYQQSRELTDVISQTKYNVRNSEVTMTLEAKSGVVLH